MRHDDEVLRKKYADPLCALVRSNEADPEAPLHVLDSSPSGMQQRIQMQLRHLHGVMLEVQNANIALGVRSAMIRRGHFAPMLDSIGSPASGGAFGPSIGGILQVSPIFGSDDTALVQRIQNQVQESMESDTAAQLDDRMLIKQNWVRHRQAHAHWGHVSGEDMYTESDEAEQGVDEYALGSNDADEGADDNESILSEDDLSEMSDSSSDGSGDSEQTRMVEKCLAMPDPSLSYFSWAASDVGMDEGMWAWQVEICHDRAKNMLSNVGVCHLPISEAKNIRVRQMMVIQARDGKVFRRGSEVHSAQMQALKPGSRISFLLDLRQRPGDNGGTLSVAVDGEAVGVILDNMRKTVQEQGPLHACVAFNPPNGQGDPFVKLVCMDKLEDPSESNGQSGNDGGDPKDTALQSTIKSVWAKGPLPLTEI